MNAVNRTSDEDRYIAMRKRKALCESLLYVLMRIFPVSPAKISVTTFEGRTGFCDNPRYIVEELHKRNPAYSFVWLMNEPDETQFPDYIKVVKNSLLNRAYHLSTSRVWLDNYRKPLGTLKRRNTVYFQTWHGSVAIKVLGLHRGQSHSRIAHIVSSHDSGMTDYSFIDSEWGREIFRDGLLYYGEFLKTGSPRTDILINERLKQREYLRKRYDLPEDFKIAIFSPTYRERGEKTEREVFNEPFSLDFSRLLKALKNRFGGEWYLLLRLHPQTAAILKEFPLKNQDKHIFDVSLERDMNEILAGADAVFTDISSTSVEASLAGIPAFLYIDDIDDLRGERGSFYWNFPDAAGEPITSNPKYTPETNAKLPCIYTRTNEELEKAILSFDETSYRESVSDFYRDMGLLCDGHSSERAADEIEKHLRK